MLLCESRDRSPHVLNLEHSQDSSASRVRDQELEQTKGDIRKIARERLLLTPK